MKKGTDYRKCDMESLIDDRLEKILSEFAERVIEEYRKGLTDKDALASKSLHNDLDYFIRHKKNNAEVVLKVNDYWKYVDYGRQKGEDKQGNRWMKRPPTSAIEKWLKYKKPSIQAKDRHGLAFYIAKKINQNGIKPKYILENCVFKVWENYKKEIDEAITDEVYGYIVDVFDLD